MNPKQWVAGVCFFATACGGATPEAEAPSSSSQDSSEEASAEDTQVHQVQVGECTEEEVAEGAKVVRASNAGWAYVAPTDAVVECTETKAVLSMGAGLNVVVTSVAPVEGGTVPDGIGALMVEKAAEGAKEADADAKMDPPEPGTFGRAGYPGHCGGARFSAQGKRLRSVVCSASATTDEGVVHYILVAITDTEEGFQKAGGTDAELFSQMVDAWNPMPGAP